MTVPRRQGLSLSAKVNAGFALALVILAVVSIASIRTMQRFEERLEWQTHSHEVIERGREVLLRLNAVEAAHRGFVLLDDSLLAQRYSIERGALTAAVDSIQYLTSDNPAQQERVELLRALLATRLAYLDSTNVLQQTAQHAAALDAIRQGTRSVLRERVASELRLIELAEYALLAERKASVTETVRRSRAINIAGILLAMAVVLASTYAINRDVRRRIQTQHALIESQNRLRDFLDSASDLIQSSGADGRLTYVNRSLLDTLGYEQHELIGKPSDMLFAPEERAHGEELFAQMLRGISLPSIRTVYLRKDGRRVHVIGSSSFRFENGRPVESRTILHDVTRQREVERMKDEFVSVVSHELRTPLTSIRGALGLLAGGMLGEVSDRGKRMLDLAISNTDRLVRLINDILDVERLESGTVPMTKRPVRLKQLITSAEDLMRPLADKAGVTLQTSTIDAEIEADTDRIAQTLTNLIGNAIKFSPAGTVVRIASVREGNNVHITVQDEGRGIPLDKLQSVFERFQQVDASDAREKGGSGLGLAICRGIIEQHEGSIWVESELGVGSTFHVVLPAIGFHAASVDVTLDSTVADGPLVLICDDDEDVRTVLSTMLAERGYRVLTAADGATAIDLAVEHRPAVVLLDLLMPGGMDGWHTMAALKDNPITCDIPVIIVSGSGASASDVVLLRKPVDPGVLGAALDDALAAWGAGAKVLVVEDDDDLAGILVEFLQKHGLDPVHARDGAEAVRLSQKVSPSLIILDLMLPDSDGLAVVDWLRQHDRLRDVPIMVYTASDLDDEKRMRLGVAPEFLFTKSRVPPEQLVDRVAVLVGRMTWRHDNSEY